MSGRLTITLASGRPQDRRIRAAERLASFLYATGLSVGGSYGYLRGPYTVTTTLALGKRPYVLWRPWEEWGCILLRHHWPTRHKVIFGLCGKCIPWPCCGSVLAEHDPRCTEQDA